MIRDYEAPVFNHTRPWLAGEYIVINGHPLVYTTSKTEGLVVRLPGRKKATPDELISAGYDVRCPRTVRNEYEEQP